MTKNLSHHISYYGGLGREAYLLLATNAVTAFQWGIVDIVLGIHLPQIGFDEVQIGSLYTARGLTGAVLGIPLAMLGDRYGRKKLLLIGIVLTGSPMLVFAVTSEYLHLLAASLIWGVGFSTVFPNWNALIADKTDESKRDVAFSLSFFLSTATSTLASALAILPELLRSQLNLSSENSYQFTLALSGIVVLSGAIPSLFIKESISGRPSPKLLPRKSLRTIVKYSSANSLIGLGAGLVIPLFPLWFFLKFSYTEVVIAPVYAVANATTALAGLMAPRISAKVGRIQCVLLTTGLATLILFMMPSVTPFLALSTLFVLRQFLMNMSHPVFTSFYMDAVKPEERASASAISGTSWAFPNAITPTVGGYLMKNASVDLPLYLCGAFYASGWILIYLFFRRPDSNSPDFNSPATLRNIDSSLPKEPNT